MSSAGLKSAGLALIMKKNPMEPNMTEPSLISDVNSSEFQAAVLERSLQQPVLVEFWADWCQSCQALMPVLERLTQEYNGAFALAKINADTEQGLLAQIGIRSLPTVVLFVGGQPVDHFQGAQPEAQVRQFLAAHVQPLDPKVELMKDFLANEQYSLALPLAQELWAQQPKLDIAQTLLRCLLGLERYSEAQQWLQTLPANFAVEPSIEVLASELQLLTQQQDLPDLAPLEQAYQDSPSASTAEPLALALAQARQPEAAMQLLLTEWAKDKSQTQLKAVLLDLFNSCKDTALVNQYRRQLFGLMH